jgi:hypothetical protein
MVLPPGPGEQTMVLPPGSGEQTTVLPPGPGEQAKAIPSSGGAEPLPTAEVPAVMAGVWSGHGPVYHDGYAAPAPDEPPFLREQTWPGHDQRLPEAQRRPSAFGRVIEKLEQWPALTAIGFAGLLVLLIVVVYLSRADSGGGGEDSADPAGGTLFQRSGVAPTPEAPVADPTSSTTAAPTTSTTVATSTTAPTTTAVSTTVIPSEQYPLAENDEVTANGRTMIEVLSNDSGGDAPINPVSLRIVTEPEHAREAFVGLGWIVYRPERGYEGSDYLEYEICDFFDRCSVAGVSITVEA